MWPTTSACPAAAVPWPSRASSAVASAPRTPSPTASCTSRSSRTRTTQPVDGKTRDLEREYRAVVEELLELRGDDGRVAAFVRSITEPGALADTAGYSPDLTYEQKVELLETLDVTERLEPRARAPARAPGRDAGAPPDPRRRPVGRREAAARVLPAQADGVDPARSSARTTARSSRSTARRSRRPACRTRSASRPSASWAGSSAWASSRARASMIRSYLDWLIAVPWSQRSDERLDPVHAREVLDADHAGLEDVKDRIVEYIAVRKLRQERGIAEDKQLRRHPHADRTARNGQDLDRRVDRPRDRTRVRPHVARRRPRRGRDPRPPADLHRRSAGPARPRPAGTPGR